MFRYSLGVFAGANEYRYNRRSGAGTMQQIEKVTTNSEVINVSLRQVAKGTVSADVGATRLLHAGPEGLSATIQHMRKITKQMKRAETLTGLVLVNGAIALTLLNVFAIILAVNAQKSVIPPTVTLGAWLIYLGGFVVLPLNLLRLARRRNRVLDVVSRFDDTRALGPVTELLERDRAAARSALMRLLPRVRAEDRAIVSPGEVENLNQLVRTLRREETELGVKVVEALGKVGDSRSLFSLERLAETRSKRLQPVREAALLALPELRQFIGNMHAGKALLRPSQAPTADLLQPASSCNAPNSDNLLSPDSKEP